LLNFTLVPAKAYQLHESQEVIFQFTNILTRETTLHPASYQINSSCNQQ